MKLVSTLCVGGSREEAVEAPQVSFLLRVFVFSSFLVLLAFVFCICVCCSSACMSVMFSTCDLGQCDVTRGDVIVTVTSATTASCHFVTGVGGTPYVLYYCLNNKRPEASSSRYFVFLCVCPRSLGVGRRDRGLVIEKSSSRWPPRAFAGSHRWSIRS